MEHSPYNNRSHAEDGLQDVRGGCLLCADRSGAETARRPGDVCSAPIEAKRRPWTHGCLPRNNRSLAEDGLQDVRGTSVLQRPKRSGDLGPMGACHATTEALRKMGRVRSGGPHATSRPSRRRDLEPWVQGSLRL